MAIIMFQMCLNVGGKKHWIMSKHFVHFPGTRLGRLARAKTMKQILELCDKYFPGKIPEYFFCHDWMGFNSILNVYRNGTLHLMSGKCKTSLFLFALTPCLEAIERKMTNKT